MNRQQSSLQATKATMKAVVYYQYGSPDVLKVTEVERPVPQGGEVLVRIHAASINAYDWHLLRAKPFLVRFLAGLFKPRNTILGSDIAGVIERCGDAATRFKPGDAVYGCLESCGKGSLATGGLAEYVCAKESVLALKPPSVTFEEAAALPMAAVTALQGLRNNGQVRQGQDVLINGASGGVGTFAVQIAKALGSKVTAVCSPGSLETVRLLGADQVIDYTTEDFTKNGRLYDLILDIAASRSVKDYRRSLKPGGTCVVVGFSTVRHTLSVVFAAQRDGKRITPLAANNTDNNGLGELNKLVESGKIRSVIDSRYPLDKAAEAIHHLETGHPKGKVVITIA